MSRPSQPKGATIGRMWRDGRCCGENEAGKAIQSDCGDNEGQLVGSSRVIHMLWNGFLSVVVEPGPRPWPGRLMTCTASGRSGPPGVRTFWVWWVQAAGSGSAPAANCGRREDPAIKAMNRLSAVTTATIDFRGVIALSRPTVAELYKKILVR